MTDQATSSVPVDVVVWRISSRSTGGSNGSNCVEVGAWRKSSRSQSGADQNCVEAGTCPHQGIAVRDSKAPSIGTLALTLADWTALLHTIRP